MPRPAEIQSIHGPYGILRRLDPAAVDARLADAVNDTAQVIEGKIIEQIQSDKGNLAAGVNVEVDVDGNSRFRITATVQAFNEQGDDYAPYVDKGTGIFGPAHQMVEASPDRDMVFEWRKPGKFRDYPGFRQGWWRMKAHHGTKPQNFMRKGWRNAMAIMRRRFNKIGLGK